MEIKQILRILSKSQWTTTISCKSHICNNTINNPSGPQVDTTAVVVKSFTIVCLFSQMNILRSFCDNPTRIDKFCHIWIGFLIPTSVPERIWIKSQLPNFCVCVRKIGPELTSVANLPLFAEEDCPWANICAHLPLFCMWDATRAWLDEQHVGPGPGSKPVNPGPSKQSAWTSPPHHRASPSVSSF